MTWTGIQIAVFVYIAGLLWIQRRRWMLLLYVWKAFGLAFIAINIAVIANWHVMLAALESSQITAILNTFHVPVQVIDNTTLLVPDATGWSGLKVGVESSTLIELSVLCGLLLFYPKQTLAQRSIRLMIGIVGTYLLNLLRLFIIIAMILLWGKPAVAIAHAFVGRLAYFIGVVLLYWFLMTKPTIRSVHDIMTDSGRVER